MPGSWACCDFILSNDYPFFSCYPGKLTRYPGKRKKILHSLLAQGRLSWMQTIYIHAQPIRSLYFGFFILFFVIYTSLNKGWQNHKVSWNPNHNILVYSSNFGWKFCQSLSKWLWEWITLGSLWISDRQSSLIFTFPT